MELFDRQDEKDDFRGVDQGSRVEVEEVIKEMHQHIRHKMNYRFLVLFQNGSSEEIDLASLCGFPLSGYSTNKVLWTFQGRFRLKPRTKVDGAIKSAGTTDTFISAMSRHEEQVPPALWSYLVHKEASEIAETTGLRGINDQRAQVIACFLYMLELCCRGHHSIDYDWATHGANYWICDGIMQQLRQGEAEVGADDGGDGSWRAADALQREVQLDVNYHQYLPSSHLARFVESKPCLISPTYYGFVMIPTGGMANGDMLQQYFDNIRVLKLSRCRFNFQSPPFQCCQSLKFLWLDHCQDSGINTDGAGKEGDVRRCFQRLWVLDVRYTNCDQILSAQMMDLMINLRELNVVGVQDWDMGQLQGRLPNIRRLRTKKSHVSCSCSENNLFLEMNKMELFEFLANNITFPMSWIYEREAMAITINNSSCLETVNIGRCEGLKWICFKGCAKLKNLFLIGWLDGLRTLDISGTVVKTLDLTAIRNDNPHGLYLLGCEKLCAIIWPPEMNRNLDNLFIDTAQLAPTDQSMEEMARKGRTFPWYISVQDERLLESLRAVYSGSREMYVEVSSPTHPTVAAAGSKDKGIIKRGGNSEQQMAVTNLQPPATYAEDTFMDRLQQASEGDDGAQGIMWMWPCPDVPNLSQESCYMHIQDQMRRKLSRSGEETSTITVPGFVLRCAKILHVHDSKSITVAPFAKDPPGFEWDNLEWCRIESCPRFMHVLPLSRAMISPSMAVSFPQLETLEITWCGDLQEVFPLDTNANRNVKRRRRRQQQPVTLYFPSLKRIHLHELPSLQRICGVRMSAPNLKTVKIRGCWSLRRLPYVGGGSKVVECDCEKEWWDKLEWDDGSQATRYKPIHSRYYKKTLLRSSVLR
ncbi:unnamed protein product [Urochloa decumbens]|uniref:Disease resistance protein At4g27190-like leucine-rich repeats domain-containing protein n=1 Tax=Urochloa decumbens TaxID=240449 RepID=A0ABC9GAD9_9POAL